MKKYKLRGRTLNTNEWENNNNFIISDILGFNRRSNNFTTSKSMIHRFRSEIRDHSQNLIINRKDSNDDNVSNAFPPLIEFRFSLPSRRKRARQRKRSRDETAKFHSNQAIIFQKLRGALLCARPDINKLANDIRREQKPVSGALNKLLKGRKTALR